MSNVEHLFENAIVALENDYYFGEWKRTETEIHNTDGVSEEVLEVIWELAIYTKYTYEPSLNAIPIKWIKGRKLPVISGLFGYDAGCLDGYNSCVDELIEDWEKENAEVTD